MGATLLATGARRAASNGDGRRGPSYDDATCDLLSSTRKSAGVGGAARRLPLRVPRDRRSDATLRRRVGVELHGFDVRRGRSRGAVGTSRRRALFPPERRAARLRRLLRAGRAAGPDLARGALPALDNLRSRAARCSSCPSRPPACWRACNAVRDRSSPSRAAGPSGLT